MANLTAVIVDDEQHCREALSGLLERKYPDIALLGMATNVPEGVVLLGKVKPKILFLDIEMGNHTGFDLLQAIGPDRPHVIFTTAHEGYAVKAIRFSALDYLLKPVDPDELGTAIGKVRQAERKPQSADQFAALLKNLAQPQGPGRRHIALPIADGIETLDVEGIVFCEGDAGRTVVHQQTGANLTIDRPLKELEDLLDPSRFVRVQSNCLVHAKHIKKFSRGEQAEVLLSDGTTVAVSARKQQEVSDSMGRL